MAISYEELLELYDRGHLVEITSKAARHPTSETPAPSKLLLARCYLQIGNVQAATALVESVHDSNPKIQARLDGIRSLLARRQGDIDLATQFVQRSIATAKKNRDTKQEAWGRLHAFRMTIGEGSQTVRAAEWEQLRRVVNSAGDPYLTVALHETASIADGQTGNFRSALRHVWTGRSILDTYPNAVLSQGLDLAAACLLLGEFNLPEAEGYLKKAKTFQSTTGHESYGAAIRANELHIDMLRGRLVGASRGLQQLKSTGTPSVTLAALEGDARLQLALGQETARDTARMAMNNPLAGKTSYSSRWAGLTLCKLLHRQHKYEELAEALDAEEATARKMDDLPLLAALLLVRAEAASEQGDAGAAGRILLQAAELGIPANAELQGHFHLSAGRILHRAQSGASQVLTGRALRTWRHRRNVLALIEAESFDKPAMPLTDYDGDARFGRNTPDTTVGAVPLEHRPFAVLDAVANAIDMGGSPALLGAELRQVAEQLGVGTYVRTVHDGRTAAGLEGTAVVNLGSEGPRDVLFTCSPGHSPEHNLALASIARIARAASSLERLRNDEKDRAALWPIADHEVDGALFIDEQMTSLLATARKVAATNVPVLITGETGTGKEVLARTIHAASQRSRSAMVPFNCTACPRDMVDAQLFGHRKGAFTGAVEGAPGVIRGASGGTLFLDEIGDAPVEVQPKLLRFLESGEVHPIGEPRPLKADVRVIAATNVDLAEAVRDGRFREDLYYRLNIVTLHIPPLRERRSDIPVMANHFLQQCAMEQRKGRLRLAEETVEYLLLYRWPGNVRQLANEIRRMAALAEQDQVLMPEHLSPAIAASRRTVPPSERQLDVDEIAVRIDQPLAAAAEHLERAMVVYALRSCNGRVEEAARRLGLSRKGLYLKRVRFGMEIADTGESQTA